ncbi:hypothetical protein [Limnohabitans sp. Hippo4]|uniref:hypothetical protein n=1 Tax=Limnohabitans sp. Hippo4 TaxID=1826167 RepID=UPI0013048444|nr:hypothetical protein [Limnohabitans sp. Hippo4]
MQSASSIDYRLHFLSIHDEIKWLKVDADMGFTNAQHRLGVLFLESASDTEELY